MRGERAPLQRKAEPVHSLVNVCRKACHIRRSFHASPEHTRVPFIWEKTKSAEIHRGGFGRTNCGEPCFNLRDSSAVGFAQKFQRDMQIAGAHPFRLWQKRAQIVHKRRQGSANLARYFDGDKQPHASPFTDLATGGLSDVCSAAGLPNKPTRRGWPRNGDLLKNRA